MMATATKGIQFENESKVSRFDSSDFAQRGFCKECGSNLFYYYKPQDLYMVCVGAFDDPSQFKLIGEIFVDSQPKGYSFAGDLKRKTEEEFLAEFS